MLDRASILKSQDIVTKEVPVPEWDGSVYVKLMSGSERDRFEAVHVKAPFADIRARLAVATVCDKEGKLLFSPGDVAEVGAKAGTALNRIFEVASALNKLSSSDVDELEKNS